MKYNHTRAGILEIVSFTLVDLFRSYMENWVDIALDSGGETLVSEEIAKDILSKDPERIRGLFKKGLTNLMFPETLNRQIEDWIVSKQPFLLMIINPTNLFQPIIIQVKDVRF